MLQYGLILGCVMFVTVAMIIYVIIWAYVRMYDVDMG